MEGSILTMAWRMISPVCIVAMTAGCEIAVTNGHGSCQSPLAEHDVRPDDDACSPAGSQSAPEVDRAESGSACVSPGSYEAALTGGHIFQMHCAACHNARALGERPFASYENAAVHMRVRANLTGEEHRKLIQFLRYWHDIPPQNPPVEPSPKRLIFSQPTAELRPEPRVPPKKVDAPLFAPPPP